MVNKGPSKEGFFNGRRPDKGRKEVIIMEKQRPTFEGKINDVSVRIFTSDQPVPGSYVFELEKEGAVSVKGAVAVNEQAAVTAALGLQFGREVLLEMSRQRGE